MTSGAAQVEGGGTQRRIGTRDVKTFGCQQGPRCRTRGGNRGSKNAGYNGRRRDMARGIDLTTEAGRKWVWETSRWTEFQAKKESGEPV